MYKNNIPIIHTVVVVVHTQFKFGAKKNNLLQIFDNRQRTKNKKVVIRQKQNITIFPAYK